ncbi:hypothetical protein BYT27DRAFT_6735480 [Phlegmacium glaucopus]|nr:hypothetical protein BYT27DRAFT_6735480 [Phlegmacium glaucopus]
MIVQRLASSWLKGLVPSGKLTDVTVLYPSLARKNYLQSASATISRSTVKSIQIRLKSKHHWRASCDLRSQKRPCCQCSTHTKPIVDPHLPYTNGSICGTQCGASGRNHATVSLPLSCNTRLRHDRPTCLRRRKSKVWLGETMTA